MFKFDIWKMLEKSATDPIYNKKPIKPMLQKCCKKRCKMNLELQI